MELIRQLEVWNEASEFSRAIAAIEAIPEPERGFQLTLWLGRLYANLAVLGDHDQRVYTDSRGRTRQLAAEVRAHLARLKREGKNPTKWKEGNDRIQCKEKADPDGPAFSLLLYGIL